MKIADCEEQGGAREEQGRSKGVAGNKGQRKNCSAGSRELGVRGLHTGSGVEQFSITTASPSFGGASTPGVGGITLHAQHHTLYQPE